MPFQLLAQAMMSPDYLQVTDFQQVISLQFHWQEMPSVRDARPGEIVRQLPESSHSNPSVGTRITSDTSVQASVGTRITYLAISFHPIQ